MTSLQSTTKSHTMSAIILAAGKGTRMKSVQPKVLHSVMGRTMLGWVMDVVKKAGATDLTLVLSNDTRPFSQLLASHKDVRVCIQASQRGTGDAVASAATAYSQASAPSWCTPQLLHGQVSSAEWVLICAADTPAINPQILREFVASTLASKRKLAVLGMTVRSPSGYGRIVVGPDGGVNKICEERDADPETKKINLCNTGIIFAQVSWLYRLLDTLNPNNAQNEYYLTDVFQASAKAGEPAHVFKTDAEADFAGVNDRMQLDRVERSMLRKRIDELMIHGVTVHLPDTLYLDADVSVESDTRLYPGVVLKGQTRIARDCMIGPGAYLEDAILDAGVQVGAHAIIVGRRISAGQTLAAGSINL